MSAVFVIEHLEPRVSKWVLIEYERISSIVGKDNLWLTNVKSKTDRSKISKFGKVFKDSVSKMSLNYSCVLDPQADQLLSPDDSAKFKFFVFGGILGDYPPKKRTNKELTQFLPDADIRNIGDKQLSTDNAVWVVNKIVNNKKVFGELKFRDRLEVRINDVESIILPYRYPLIDGKPSVSPKIIDLLKKKKGM
ncbi:MAG: SAM-dependent methyltransferase [Nanoarchaeota archaeon]